MLLVSRICSRVPARFFAAAALCLLTVPASVRADEDSITLAPNNPDVVAVVQVADVLESPAFKKIAGEFPDLIKLDEPLGKKTKLTPRDIDSVVVTADTAKQDFVVVFNLDREFCLEDVINEDDRAKAEEIGDYTLYILTEDNALCLVDESTIAMGPAKTLRAVLARDDDAEISKELEAAIAGASDEQPIYIVATLGALAQRATGTIPQNIPVTPETIGKLKMATITADAGENAITISASLDCTDGATAEQLKSLLDALLQAALQPEANTPAECRQALGSVNSSVEGEIFAITFDVDFDLILAQIKSQLAGAAQTP
ncbi:MAG TPA: hypothetical protein VG826_07425 [Pirellulales bacterium]|nr:hypothetical protein [Pirellulales bacterium]